MKKILVTGATGQLGSELSDLSENYKEFKWIFADRNKVNLNDLNLLKIQLNEIKPDIILNCAAYTAVDKAEEEKELAFTINHLAVELIAKYAIENLAKLIHISTDYVFDGNSFVALDETASTNPVNTYGKSKREGEIACLKVNPDSIIIRTSWVYSKYGNNFVKTMQRLMKERDAISVVDDQIGSPTYAADLAQVLVDIVKFPNWIPGIYNYSNEGKISWYDFALEIKKLGEYSCDVKPISSLDYPTSAKRPKFSILDHKKINKVYKIEIPFYEKSLRKMFLSQDLNI